MEGGGVPEVFGLAEGVNFGQAGECDVPADSPACCHEESDHLLPLPCQFSHRDSQPWVDPQD